MFKGYISRIIKEVMGSEFKELRKETDMMLNDITYRIGVLRETDARVNGRGESRIHTSDMNTATHMFDGYVITGTPATGTVTWSDLNITYKGITYNIVNGNTTKKYLYFDFDGTPSNLTLASSDTKPVLTVDDILIGVNDGGVFHSSMTAGKVVHGAMIGENTINTAELNSGAVTEAILGTNAVTVNKLATGAVTEVKLGTGAVTNAKLGAGAVTDLKILDGAVTNGKIGAGAVTDLKIADNAVTVNKLINGAVTDVKILDGAVKTTKIADNAITSLKILDGAIGSLKIGTGAVTSLKIEDGAVTNGKIGAGAVAESKLNVATHFIF